MACAHRRAGGPLPVVGSAPRAALEYDVVHDGAGTLDVEASIPPGFARPFSVDGPAIPFVRDVAFVEDGRTRAAPRVGGAWDLSSCSAGCRVRYRVALAEACETIGDISTAQAFHGLQEAPPSTWLLAPTDADEATRIAFRVRTPPPLVFVTGVFRSPEGGGVHALTWGDLQTSPYSGFGGVRTLEIPVPGASITLALDGPFDVGDGALAGWVKANAEAVAGWFGRFPVPHALVILVSGGAADIDFGKSLSGGGASVFLRVGARAGRQDLARDWVLAHELVHLGFPAQPRYRDWMEEGLATYVEPLARAKAGLLDDAAVWRGFLTGMHFGLPERGDRGLDRTHTWGRVYWGGALFWLVADLEIRRRTAGARSLRHALAAIVAAGGNNAVRCAAPEACRVGDAATGTTVLAEMVQAWSEGPVDPQLDAVYMYLGVALGDGGEVLLDDRAPGSATRRTLTRAP